MEHEKVVETSSSVWRTDIIAVILLVHIKREFSDYPSRPIHRVLELLCVQGYFRFLCFIDRFQMTKPHIAKRRW